MTNPVLIAGNGPSLANIDYRRLPGKIDIFRSNQFYFEEKYFLGREVTATFLNPDVIKEQFFTLKMLEERGEYKIGDIYCIFSTSKSEYQKGSDIRDDFPRIKSTYDYVKKFPQFCEIERFQAIYYKENFTSAIWMIFTALSLGYKEIYLAGIDFYEGDTVYAFDSKKPNLIATLPEFGEEDYIPHQHNKKMDLQGLTLALSVEGGRQFYSICEDTPINEYVPLAPITNGEPILIVTKKEGAISDFCMLPNAWAAFRDRPVVHFFKKYDLFSEYKALKGNIYFRFIWDLISFPRIVFKIFIRLLRSGKKNN